MKALILLLCITSVYGSEALSPKDVEAMDNAVEAKVEEGEVVLPNGEKMIDFLLDKDPCFLVKNSTNEEILKLATVKCEKLNK